MKNMKFDDGKGVTFNITEVGNVEFVNPIEMLFKQVYNHSINFDREIFRINEDRFKGLAENIKNPEVIIERVIKRNADKLWTEIFNNIQSQSLPNNILNILECNNKREQYKILKGLKLNRDQLMLLIFKAWEIFGFTYSTYRFEHLPKGITPNQLPQVAYLEENGDITVVGTTNLSNPQLKQVIEQRRVLVAKFMEKGDLWHCFFYTYKAINGNEARNFRHMHYVSNTWNFTRTEALSKLKDKYYPFSNTPHIEYIGD